MRGDQARKVCPEVQLVQVPTAHGKADLTLYRDAGKQASAPPETIFAILGQGKQGLLAVTACLHSLKLQYEWTYDIASYVS